MLAYATAPGSVGSDGLERNGLYTSKLLKHVLIPGLRLVDEAPLVRGGMAARDEAAAAAVLRHSEFTIHIDLKAGTKPCDVLTCDLSLDYGEKKS